MDATSRRESSNGMIRHHMQSPDAAAAREYEIQKSHCLLSAIVFLSCGESAHITGEDLVVDGGHTL